MLDLESALDFHKLLILLGYDFTRPAAVEAWDLGKELCESVIKPVLRCSDEALAKLGIKIDRIYLTALMTSLRNSGRYYG